MGRVTSTEMLGHASLATTQIYTHLSIKKLQKIHAATHPAARLERVEGADSEPRKGVDEDERAELLSSLAAEDGELDER
jgi:integrase/recombinase XerD